MKMTTKQKIAEIQRMTVGEMRREYIEVFGEETRSGNRQWMYRRLAWRLQALDEGGITNRARQRARELVRDQDIRVIPAGGDESGAAHTNQLTRHLMPRISLSTTVTPDCLSPAR